MKTLGENPTCRRIHFDLSLRQVPTSDDLRALLGMHQPVSLIVDLKLDLDTMPKLIMSPSRNKNGHANRWVRFYPPKVVIGSQSTRLVTCCNGALTPKTFCLMG